MILNTAYFPPVEYFCLLASPAPVYIDDGENYQKQSYRNRCRILSTAGVQELNFPVLHDGTVSIREIKVDYSTPWLRKTQKAIDTAYFSSSYFEYYRDSLYEFMDRRPPTLWELDYGIMAFFCSKIGIPLPLPLSESNLPAPDRRGGDLIHPKKRPILVNRPYWQLFGAEFKANLSIMDLLFNEGPDSICYLK